MERVQAVRSGATQTEEREEWVRTGPRPNRVADGFGRHQSPQTVTRVPLYR